jgi:hypothetical protein
MRAVVATYLGLPYEATPEISGLADSATFWSDRITRQISLAVSYGSPLVWCLERLMDSQWGVGMYRLRGQLSEAQEMERRLGYR